MRRPPLDFKPMTDRVAVTIEPHHRRAGYEISVERAEALLADLHRAISTARKWADDSGASK